ncbi:hypothetical protein KIPB_012021 [Kipferlia bialata]|uniref:Uncharacterized protein n=1 Tax=Kipferlia bialata TaxID=797122 RepID=A0A9K3D922_9EUKA|nr:hypothetical protein KIPB_012021 [Kipferlia bialata]|eukprot:g12021.t1
MMRYGLIFSLYLAACAILTSAHAYTDGGIYPQVPFAFNLTNPEPNTYSQFGAAVDISGDWSVVGAPYYDGDETHSGA